MDSKIGILSDIHANPFALEKVFADACDIDEWLFLGDVVGYGPCPVDALKKLREKVIKLDNWLIGNHDAFLLGLIANPGANDAAITLADHKSQIEADPKMWQWCLSTWKSCGARLQQRSNERVNISFVHGSLSVDSNEEIFTYLFPWPDLAGIEQLRHAFQVLSELAFNCQTQVLIHGHTHIPSFAAKRERGQSWELKPIHYREPQPLDRYAQVIICPGSVGLPRNPDPDPHAAYGILNLADSTDSTFEFRKVVLGDEIEGLFNKMQERKYPLELIYLIQGAYPENPLRKCDWVWKEWDRIYKRKPWGWALK